MVYDDIFSMPEQEFKDAVTLAYIKSIAYSILNACAKHRRKYGSSYGNLIDIELLALIIIRQVNKTND